MQHAVRGRVCTGVKDVLRHVVEVLLSRLNAEVEEKEKKEQSEGTEEEEECRAAVRKTKKRASQQPGKKIEARAKKKKDLHKAHESSGSHEKVFRGSLSATQGKYNRGGGRCRAEGC